MNVRYIVKSSSGDFSEVGVLADTASEALRVAAEMAERDVRSISIVDAEGAVHDPEALQRMVDDEAAAEPAAARRSA